MINTQRCSNIQRSTRTVLRLLIAHHHNKWRNTRTASVHSFSLISGFIYKPLHFSCAFAVNSMISGREGTENQEIKQEIFSYVKSSTRKIC